ncbi:sigma54 specific transcriptional regulator, Fis family [Thermosinus carboxydivorans Nor1]|uniref:Sigma54 specific transcriptional regulator, Fis family n=1 Tax=Thermosinus carboxydivorans Nor1 TaxID=401526 RepID=A1HSK4_9FIRM|nr:sigma 54-interacting transcriptional regulator [Thermosinus carboxydivorans]EAX46976.1 sigma54 specific transcriptional regulator, Fis family [Thermosinus carboxydivorans Nor1]
MPDIVVIATHGEWASLTRQLAAGDSAVSVVQARLAAGVAAARQAVAEGARVLISRGVTCGMIAAALPQVPLVEVKFTGFDLLRALLEAQAAGGPVAIVDRQEVLAGLAAIEEILGVPDKARKIAIDDYRQYRAGVDQAVRAGAACIIGNQAVVDEAEAYGLRGILLRSGPEGIRHALELSRQMLTIQRMEEANARRIETIINSVDYGIIAVDNAGAVTALNREARRLLALAHGAPDNHPLLVKLRRHGQLGERLTGSVERLEDGRELVINYLPITIGGETAGAVATLQELRQFQDIERRTRQELARRGRLARHTFLELEETAAPAMRAVIDEARRFAAVDATILIQGETGVGKEYFAHAIHAASPRRYGPFVAVNCAAIPATVLESELFGYAEGAFTGAKKGGKVGLFEQAHGGTIFLDEIGEMAEELQARLLRVLQEHEIYRIGDDRVIPVDIRVIAATNRDLRAMVAAGRFREDLYYRLDVLALEVPPLRARKQDIPLFVRKFIDEFNHKYRRAVQGIDDEGLALLAAYDWPGNVRELHNVVDRLMALAAGPVITATEVRQCLERRLRSSDRPAAPGMKAAEAAAIRDALARANGNKQQAARLLGIGRSTLWRKLRELGIADDISK